MSSDHLRVELVEYHCSRGETGSPHDLCPWALSATDPAPPDGIAVGYDFSDPYRIKDPQSVLIGRCCYGGKMIRYPTFFAIIGIATAIWKTASLAQDYYRWGVFRERSLFGIPFDQRRCRIQEIGSGEIICDELLARRTTRAEAALDYRFLVSRGLCAP